MKKTKEFSKQILSGVMTLVMVCSVMAGVTISNPEVTVKAEEEGTSITTPVVEEAENGQNLVSEAQSTSIQSVTITTLDEWNELCFNVSNGADTSNATITFGANIDAVGKTISNMSSFAGSLDGAGYAIIGASFKDNGLIGILESGATVKNLLVMNASLTNKKAESTGLLVGTNHGIVESCGVTGTVTGGKYVGGMVGCNKGTVSHCFNGAMVTTSKESAGGIAGWTEGIITNCYNYGVILGTTKVSKTYSISGCTADNSSKLVNCYTVGGNIILDSNDKMVTVKTSEEMAEEAFISELNGGGNAFVEGNGYPTIADVKYAYMTPGGSANALLETKEEPENIVWIGNKSGLKLTTSLKATKWIDENGKIKNGSIVWLVEDYCAYDISFDMATHKVNKDDFSTYAATIKNGVVQGKLEDDRIYVYAVDTGSMTAEVFLLESKKGPTSIVTYHEDIQEGDYDSYGVVTYTSDTVPEGESIKIFYRGFYGKLNKGGDILLDEELTYTLTVPEKYKDYITYTSNIEDGYFEVTVKEGAIAQFGKGNKAFTVPLTIKNDQTGAKGTFKVIVSNPVNEMTWAAGEGVTMKTEMVRVDSDSGEESEIIVVHLPSAAKMNQIGYITETIELYNPSGVRTDSTKIIQITDPSLANALYWSGYKYTQTGAITANGRKLSSEQKKVSMAAVKGQPGTYKITAKKGIQEGTEAYFIVWHNSFGRTVGKGYQIIKVVVGEANHAYSMKLEAKSGEGINAGVTVSQENDYVGVSMPSATKAKQTVYLTETFRLDDEASECTDYNLIYRLPYKQEFYYHYKKGNYYSFDVFPNGVVTVNDVPASTQKKVSMKYENGNYVITAAKGTPEGTEAYFLVYHNPYCYSVVSVTVGETNKVLASEFYTEDSSVKVTTKSSGMTEVEVPLFYSGTKTIVLKEKRTLENNEKVTTDATKILQMEEYDDFQVSLNRSMVTRAGGKLSAEDKKFKLALQKGSSDTFVITIKGGTLGVGMESYFLVYHNFENEESGTGYHVIRIKIGN